MFVRRLSALSFAPVWAYVMVRSLAGCSSTALDATPVDQADSSVGGARNDAGGGGTAAHEDARASGGTVHTDGAVGNDAGAAPVMDGDSASRDDSDARTDAALEGGDGPFDVSSDRPRAGVVVAAEWNNANPFFDCSSWWLSDEDLEKPYDAGLAQPDGGPRDAGPTTLGGIRFIYTPPGPGPYQVNCNHDFAPPVNLENAVVAVQVRSTGDTTAHVVARDADSDCEGALKPLGSTWTELSLETSSACGASFAVSDIRKIGLGFVVNQAEPVVIDIRSFTIER